MGYTRGYSTGSEGHLELWIYVPFANGTVFDKDKAMLNRFYC